MRSSLRALLGTVLLAGFVTPAHAVLFTLNTADTSSASNLTLELLLSDPNSAPFATLGPVGVTGDATADINLDSSDSGTLQINGSNLSLSNYGPTTVSLGAFGTVDASLLNTQMSIAGGPVAVSNNAFQINSSTPGQITIDNGTVVLANPTGTLAALLPGGTSIDFSTSPISVPFSSLGSSVINGTTDDDSGLYASGGEVNIPLNAAVQITDLAGIPVYARLVGNVSLGSVGVPEAGAMTLLALMSLGAAGAAGARRFFRRAG